MYLLPNGAQVHGLGDDFVIVRRVRLGDGPVKRPPVAVSQQACTIIFMLQHSERIYEIKGIVRSFEGGGGGGQKKAHFINCKKMGARQNF